MGISSFFKRKDDVPESSAFDAINDDVRQLIANDVVAIVECVKAWRVAIISPEHGKAMLDETKGILRSLGTKMVTTALMSGGDLDGIGDMDWKAVFVTFPQAIQDIIVRVKTQLVPEAKDTPNGSGA